MLQRCLYSHCIRGMKNTAVISLNSSAVFIVSSCFAHNIFKTSLFSVFCILFKIEIWAKSLQLFRTCLMFMEVQHCTEVPKKQFCNREHWTHIYFIVLFCQIFYFYFLSDFLLFFILASANLTVIKNTNCQYKTRK